MATKIVHQFNPGQYANQTIAITSGSSGGFISTGWNLPDPVVLASGEYSKLLDRNKALEEENAHLHRLLAAKNISEFIE